MFIKSPLYISIPFSCCLYQAYTRSLKFDAKPDIPYLRKLFRDLYVSQGCANIGVS